MTYAFPVQSTLAKGRVVSIYINDAQAVPSVIRVLTHENEPHIEAQDPELAVLQSVMDSRFGDYVNHDLAEYHIATNADVGEVDITWIDEDDPHLNPMGAKGVGEVGIVGTAAAVANAVYNATGVRVRDLPITLDKLLT